MNIDLHKDDTQETASVAPVIEESTDAEAELQAVEASLAQKEDPSLANSDVEAQPMDDMETEVQPEAVTGETETTEETAVTAEMKIPKTNAKPKRRYRIFVGMIKKGTTEEQFKTYMESQGAIVEMSKLASDRPFAFVSVDTEEARTALCNGKHTVNETDLNLQPAKPKTKKYFIGGCSHTTTDEMLKSHFSQYGDISEAFVVKGRGFGFVTMEADQAATFQEVLRATHNIDGRDVDVKYAEPKPQGGRGGRFGGRGGRGRGGFRGGFNHFAPYQGGGYGGYGGGYGGGFGGGYGGRGGYGGAYGGGYGGRGGYGPRW